MKPTGLLGKAGLDDSNGGEGGAASTVLLVLDKRSIFVVSLISPNRMENIAQDNLDSVSDPGYKGGQFLLCR